jgi:hypothetical protein
VHFWRLITTYPEIMAWERLQWDNLHDFRERIAGAARVAHPGICVGYHFQNAVLCLIQGVGITDIGDIDALTPTRKRRPGRSKRSKWLRSQGTTAGQV